MPFTRDIPNNIVECLTRGELVVVADARGRGHGIVAGVAGLLTGRHAALMAIHARGLLSVTVDQESAFRLGLRRMPGRRGRNTAGTEFLVSIEASSCEGTGISAHDRALTIRCAGAPESVHDDLVSPGHIAPLLVTHPARPEASLPEIVHLLVKERCGFPVAAWCDILNDEGDVASFSECRLLAATCGLVFLDVERVRAGASTLPTQHHGLAHIPR